jgi:ribulose-5-phosphate 4-epimerase/fuculose-1-phosphate aldolase
MTDTNAALAGKLITAWRFFYGRGFVDGFGHISARTEYAHHLLLTPHALGYDATPDDLVIVDLDGRQHGREVRLPSELPIHLEIYKSRPDVGSIAHFHCHFATSFSMSARNLQPTYFLASIFRDGIPVHHDSRLIRTPDRAASLAKTLGPHRAALMRAHGIVVTGQDIEEMTAGVFIMEDNARRTWLAAAMGEFETLSAAEMAENEDEILRTRGPIDRIWALCEEEAARR